jgi:hypothetical protein
MIAPARSSPAGPRVSSLASGEAGTDRDGHLAGGHGHVAGNPTARAFAGAQIARIHGGANRDHERDHRPFT